MAYHAGEVQTGIGKFDVPRLPKPWKEPKIVIKQLVHENDPLQATIVTDALCGPKYDDAPLPRLAREMYQRLQPRQIQSESSFTLDGRQAVRMRGEGAMDGVPMRMEVVAMKKDFCLYDFIYFAPPSSFGAGLKDFETYLYGFRTR